MKIDHPRPGQVPQLKALWAEAFGDPPEFIDSFFHTAYGPHHCRCIWQGERVLAAAYWLDFAWEQGSLAYIYAVATAGAARGRGLCRALMEDICDRLTARGYAGAVLVPGDPGLKAMYEKMGFRGFSGVRLLEAAAGGEPVALRQINVMEYSRLRRELAPPGSAHPGPEALRFLEKGFRFAAGADFLLAYAPVDGSLWGAELLGNSRQAGGILRALGLPSGKFRIPGEGDFALFRSLDGSPAPSYFGHAFD